LKAQSILIGVFLFTCAAPAQGQRKLNIKSAHDTFDVIVQSRTKGSVDGKMTVLRSLADLWPVLDNPIGNECPALKVKPDATITENGKSRSIYIKAGIVTDGKFCMNVGGDGLFFFPLHRDFLIGKSQDSIQLKSPLKVFRQGVKILDLRKEQNQWVSESKDRLLNWDFIERFENSVREFDVRLRVQNDIVAGKPKMLVRSADQTYEFYKVTKVMWAVKKPGYPWLIASDDWSFWYDFDQSLLEDRFAPEIRLLQNPATTPELRTEALGKLEGAWSRNIRDLYHSMVKNPSENTDHVRTAMNRLRRKPSPETAGVMVQFLSASRDDELKRLAGQILKTQNPKGPLYKPSAPTPEKAKVITYWNNWWKNQNGK
jgi:hypothetical protein